MQSWRVVISSVLLFLAALGKGGMAMAFELTSSAFAPGADIPKLYTCDGPDRSPPLH